MDKAAAFLFVAVVLVGEKGGMPGSWVSATAAETGVVAELAAVILAVVEGLELVGGLAEKVASAVALVRVLMLLVVEILAMEVMVFDFPVGWWGN